MTIILLGRSVVELAGEGQHGMGHGEKPRECQNERNRFPKSL